MTHTTQHNAATLHAALMAAAAAAPEFQNNEIGQASCDVSNASQLRAVYFDDGLIDRIHYAQRMGWKETQGEWLIQTTMEETFSELAATCDQRPSHVSVKTATGRLKLVNTRNRLQGFANEVARSKASWALWGGGNMPAELAKPRKAKPTTTWHTTSLNVCVQCFEDKHFSDGLAMALGKLGAVAYWHQDNPKNEPFLMLAPQPVEGMPARLVSGRHAIGGAWVVFDTVSGYSIKGYKAARSRAAAERVALDTWKEKTPAQIDAALNRVTANDTTKALARLCELWKVEDVAEALADAQAKAEALAADAEAQALAADAVAPVAADVAPVADTVAALVADAVAAVAIDAAQTTARADELAQVATVADEAACVADAVAADAVACVADELACVADAVADAVACMPRSEHSGQPPSHTPTGTGFATPGSSQHPASQAGKSGGQRIAGKSGKWVATFHTTPTGLPGMVYTADDGQAQAHEFASGAERMATLQRLARLADAQPATAANVAHLAAFDPSGVDVWQRSTREVQAMAEAHFVALVQHLENVNHHTAALFARCLRAGCDDLAEACTRLENAHMQAGQLTPALALARFTIGRLLRGESVNMAEAGAGSGLDAIDVSEALALVGNAYPNEKAAATPHTPPHSAADAQATPPVCAADAPDYTDPLKTLGDDYTHPVETLGALQITLTRGEGPSNECGKPQTVASFDAADAVLQNWSRNAPEHGGYDKCDFLITWPDGDTYSGRYDLKHYRTERPSLARHMVDMVDFYTGKGCPAHMSEAAYTNHLNRIDADTRQAYEATAQRLNAAGIHTGKARPVSVDLRELVAMGMPVADLVGLGVTYCGDSMSAPEVGAIVEAEAVAKNAGFYRVGLMGNPGPAALANVDDLQVTIQTETGATYTAWHDDFSGRTGARYRLDMKRHGAPYLAQLAAAVAMRTAQATAAKELEAKAHADELARLAVEFAHLERLENGRHGGGVFAARNMRTELKRAFPGVKFSVKSDYRSVDVRWTDGPTDAQVGEVIGRFDIGASDSQSDYFYTISTAFSELFGGVQYLNTHRETSDAFTAEAIAEFWAAEFADVANAPAMPTAEDWRKNTGFFDWRADNWQTRNFRDHLAAKAGPLPTTKATRQAKA